MVGTARRRAGMGDSAMTFDQALIPETIGRLWADVGAAYGTTRERAKKRFRSALKAHLATLDEETTQQLVHAMYWAEFGYENLRAATDRSAADFLDWVGPEDVEVVCANCGENGVRTFRDLSSRKQAHTVNCAECRERDRRAVEAQAAIDQDAADEKRRVEEERQAEEQQRRDRYRRQLDWTVDVADAAERFKSKEGSEVLIAAMGSSLVVVTLAGTIIVDIDEARTLEEKIHAVRLHRR